MKRKRAGLSAARRESQRTTHRTPQAGTSGGHGASFRQQAGSAANAQQRYHYYRSLAEAAEKSGDMVMSESYYQFADHYYRLLRGTDTVETQTA